MVESYIMSLTMQEPIAVPESEEPQIQALNLVLNQGRAALVSASGERVEFPNTLYEVLTRIVEMMSRHQAVTIVPDNQVVTTQRAAAILGMSRPFFIKLLEAGVMAHHRVGFNFSPCTSCTIRPPIKSIEGINIVLLPYPKVSS